MLHKSSLDGEEEEEKRECGKLIMKSIVLTYINIKLCENLPHVDFKN